MGINISIALLLTDKKRVKIKKADFIAVKFPFFSYTQKC